MTTEVTTSVDDDRGTNTKQYEYWRGRYQQELETGASEHTLVATGTEAVKYRTRLENRTTASASATTRPEADAQPVFHQDGSATVVIV
jgi:hypothetical protein